MVTIDGLLHIVEIKRAGHAFDDLDFDRLINYVDAFGKFLKRTGKPLPSSIGSGGLTSSQTVKSSRRAAISMLIEDWKKEGRVKRVSWRDFLTRARKCTNNFLTSMICKQRETARKGIMSKLRAVSLFSNCGAGGVGYRNAGFRFDVMAELDPKRLDVCLLNHPGAEGVPR